MSIKKKSERLRKREVIGKRQGGKEMDGVYKVPCFYCGHWFALSQRHLTFDHLKPKRDGGLATYPNLVLACSLCNHAREGCPRIKGGTEASCS